MSFIQTLCGILLTLNLFILPKTVAASPVDAPSWGPWTEAKALFDSQKYEDAMRLLQSQPRYEGAFYYNLGTVMLKLGRPGQALAYLEKANHLTRHDRDIQKNLSAARAALGKLIGEDQLDPASTWSERFSDNISLEEVRGALGLVAMILAFIWLRAYRSTRSLKKMIAQPAGAFVMVGLAICVGLYVSHRLLDPGAICLERQAVRSGPGDRFLELGQIDAGVKVRMISSSRGTEPSDTWYQVRFSPSSVGWIKSSGALSL